MKRNHPNEQEKIIHFCLQANKGLGILFPEPLKKEARDWVWGSRPRGEKVDAYVD
jgi:hypothetical protein